MATTARDAPALDARPAVAADADVDWVRLFLYLWRLARPEFWLVCIVPYYVGFVVASRALLPGLALWSSFWARAVAEGATTRDFLATLAEWLGVAQPLILGALALGPFTWGSTLVYNDYWDVHADERNPRRAKSPLVRRLVSRRGAHRYAWVLGLLGLGTAALVSAEFVAVMALCLLLSWAYSAPPLRLKSRAGADVAVNAVGIGFLCSLAGWSLARPMAEFHWLFFVQGALVFVGIYVPTTMVDHRYDKEQGLDTVAVRLGLRRTFWLGFGAFALAGLGAVAFAWADFVIPRSFLPVMLPFTFLLLVQYYYLIGDYEDERSVMKGVVLSSLTMLVVNACFALVYTGIWRL